jgi:hypothetical protein
MLLLFGRSCPCHNVDQMIARTFVAMPVRDDRHGCFELRGKRFRSFHLGRSGPIARKVGLPFALSERGSWNMNSVRQTRTKGQGFFLCGQTCVFSSLEWTDFGRLLIGASYQTRPSISQDYVRMQTLFGKISRSSCSLGHPIRGTHKKMNESDEQE